MIGLIKSLPVPAAGLMLGLAAAAIYCVIRDDLQGCIRRYIGCAAAASPDKQYVQPECSGRI